MKIKELELLQWNLTHDSAFKIVFIPPNYVKPTKKHTESALSHRIGL